jgi:hypothetical protein
LEPRLLVCEHRALDIMPNVVAIAAIAMWR